MERAYYERYWKRLVDPGEKGWVSMPPDHMAPQDAQKFVSSFENYLHGKVLDIGCGAGFIARAIRDLSRVNAVVGIDISATAMSRFRDNCPDLDGCTASLTELPFRDRTFDAATCIEVVEHVLDTERMFCEFNRVLREDGILVITTTDFNFLKKVIIAVLFWDKYFYPTNPHIRFYTKCTLTQMLAKYGFEPVEHRWNGSYWRLMPWGQLMIARKRYHL